MTPMPDLVRRVPKETIGVLTKPLAKCTLMPWLMSTLAVVSAKSSPAKRQSWPTTTLVPPGYFAFSQLARPMVTRATFSTVNSCAMMARQPSVPNLILLMYPKKNWRAKVGRVVSCRGTRRREGAKGRLLVVRRQVAGPLRVVGCRAREGAKEAVVSCTWAGDSWPLDGGSSLFLLRHERQETGQQLAPAARFSDRCRACSVPAGSGARSRYAAGRWC